MKAKSAVSSSSSLFLTLLLTYGAVTIYKNIKSNKRSALRLQHINQYENQGYVIANSSQIMNRYNCIPANQPLNYTNKEIVKPYIEELEKALGPDIRLAKNNFSTLKLERSRAILKTGARGLYNGSENIIKYVKNNKSIMGHEVLHMASYMYDPTLDIHFHGFMQQKGAVVIGTGLNEGYTELMNARLFNDGKVTAYKRLVRIVKLLEQFFPNKQDMSHYYFTCNLPAFLQNLRQYYSNEELKEILHGLDKLYEYSFIPGNIAGIRLETQLASKIYSIYERNFGAEPEKIENFKQIAGENKLTAIAIGTKRHKVQRTNPFTRIKTGIQKGFRKIKNFFKRNDPTPQPAYTR